MQSILYKIPFLIELFFNGTFILLYSLHRYGRMTTTWGPEIINNLLFWGARGVPVVMLFIVMAHLMSVHRFEDFFRKYVFSLIVFIPLVITLGDLEFCFWLSSAHLLSSILSLYEMENENKRANSESILRMFQLPPAQLVLLTFAGLIFVGTTLLMLPMSSTSGEGIQFVDALFTATSATCVTGLSTLSTQGDFSLFGQIVILFLIQIGGLGIMILYSSLTIVIGRSMPMKERIVMQDIMDVSSQEELIGMIIDIIKYTFIIELWGAIILTVAFTFEGFDFGISLYYGIFHSIAAFCNAGFALFDNNLESFSTNPMIHGTIAALITLGGLGFIVLKELTLMISEKKGFTRLGLHTKTVLVTSAVLTLSGTLIIFFGEFLNALDGYSLWEKLQISFFQSVTLRTAGFNTIPLTNLHSHTLYLMAMFMFIGASPGSTGGGIKTSTFAILIQSIRSILVGRDQVELFDRTIPNSIVVKTMALTIISMIIATFSIFILMKLESDQSFLSIFFEVISALGTVGLSLNLSPYLSALGKCAISLVMFVGRVGPLTLILAIKQPKRKGIFDYPEGRLMIG